MTDIKKVFQGPSNNSIASFDYNDLASGNAYKTFYFTSSQDDSGTTYHLTDQTDRGTKRVATGTGGGTEYNFDTPVFEVPRTVKGSVIISFQSYIASSSHDFHINVYHVAADSTETALITQIEHNINTSATIIVHWYTAEVTEKLVARGEKLRISILLTSATGVDGEFGINPEGSTAGTNLDSTVGKISFPFRIDE